ncbi:hypothetical protein EI94DRAFT_1710041 [Lactarius quietus]|nr:hypothetical protein EI94DRAFT_1710041 [Lactarius quietus]
MKRVRAGVKYIPIVKDTNHGRKQDSTISQLCIRVKEKGTGKSAWRCIGYEQHNGTPCPHVAPGNADSTQILDHCKNCNFLTDNLKRLAWDVSASRAVEKEQVKTKASAQAAGGSDGGGKETRPRTLTNLTGHPATLESFSKGKVQPEDQQTSLYHKFAKQGRKDIQDHVNAHLIKLSCVHRIPLHIYDSHEWKKFVTDLASGKYKSYKPISASHFEKAIIPYQAAFMRKMTRDQLKTEQNITVSLDGMSTRNMSSAYTIHATTACHDSYLLGTHFGSGQHHDAEYVQTVVDQGIEAVGGPQNVDSVTTDDTGNMKKGRHINTTKHPTILNMPDCVHAIHNTMKEVTNMLYWKQLISEHRYTTTYIRKSTLARKALQIDGKAAAAMKDALDDPKLEIPMEVKTEVLAIVNQRWKAFINDGPEDFYFAAFYFDPHKQLHAATGYSHTDFLKNPTVGFSTAITVPGGRFTHAEDEERILFPWAHDRVRKFVHHLVMAELPLAVSCSESGHKNDGLPVQTILGLALEKYKQQDVVCQVLGLQLQAFGEGCAPFKWGRGPTVDSLKYWKDLQDDEDADVLADQDARRPTTAWKGRRKIAWCKPKGLMLGRNPAGRGLIPFRKVFWMDQSGSAGISAKAICLLRHY